MDDFKLSNSKLSNFNDNTLRLLSINKVSKILCIRYETVKKMIYQGKIAYLKIYIRYKIPYINLMKFIDEQSIRNEKDTEQSYSVEEISQKIDKLIAEYSGVSLN